MCIGSQCLQPVSVSWSWCTAAYYLIAAASQRKVTLPLPDRKSPLYGYGAGRDDYVELVRTAPVEVGGRGAATGDEEDSEADGGGDGAHVTTTADGKTKVRIHVGAGRSGSVTTPTGADVGPRPSAEAEILRQQLHTGTCDHGLTGHDPPLRRIHWGIGSSSPHKPSLK